MIEHSDARAYGWLNPLCSGIFNYCNFPYSPADGEQASDDVTRTPPSLASESNQPQQWRRRWFPCAIHVDPATLEHHDAGSPEELSDETNFPVLRLIPCSYV